MLAIAFALWVVRWLALVAASFAGQRLLPRDNRSPDDGPAPGWMPSPFEGADC